MAELDAIQARRLSRASSDHFRVPSPSDFTPRPLPMPRYNGPPGDSYAPDLRKRQSVRSRPSVDGLRADLEAHRLSVPMADRSRSYSTSSSPRSSMAGSSRRSSARFSILSEPQDLDILSSLGGAPDIDDFFNQSLPILDELDLMSSPPPNVPLPSLSDSPSRISDLAPRLFVTPTIQARTISRALSPIHGEDENTPVQRSEPVFSATQRTDTLIPGTPVDDTPLARQARSPIGMTPLMAFPIPPTRAVSFEGRHSTLFDEIDKLVASELDVVSSVAESTLQPAPTLEIDSSEASPSPEQKASFSSPEILELAPSVEESIREESQDGEDARITEEEEAAPVSSEYEEYEPSEAVTDADDTDIEGRSSPDLSGPSSPGLYDLMNHFRGFQLRDTEHEVDEPDYEVPLYEAAVRAGILSSRSQLLWPSKPKRRTFIPARLAVPVAQSESTGWSGSESEEEEFNEVLANIGRRKLAQKTMSTSMNQRLTPPKDHRSSLRLSMISESSTSSASSIEILTPDPHRTKFAMGPYDPLNPSSYTPTRLSVTTRSWSASKASTGAALGIPIPIRRVKSFTRVLPAPKRNVKGWGRPEILLEDDEAPLVNSSSEDEDQIIKIGMGRPTTPTTAPSKGRGTKVFNEDSPLRLKMSTSQDSEEEEEGDNWLMNETEPEFIAGQFNLTVPPTRYLGVPF